MHPRDMLAGIRVHQWGDKPPIPPHGGVRVVTQERRSGAETIATIVREQTEHKSTIDEFHKLFYASRQTHGMTFYEGVPLLKNPLDLWVYQEILWDLRPTLLIETGTAYGGSALYFARQFDRIGEGKVLSIDLEPAEHLPQHARVSYVRGFSSIYKDLVASVREIAKSHPRVMVVLDSDHSMRHVLQELDAYAPMVTSGQFLVVEDTNINGRPVEVDWQGGLGPGPAVDRWLPDHDEFEVAVMAERYLLTHNPGGWLRRVGVDDVGHTTT